ncbi:MAG: hypothetical protein V4697_00620 [Patescibacteria group bacterium]
MKNEFLLALWLMDELKDIPKEGLWIASVTIALLLGLMVWRACKNRSEQRKQDDFFRVQAANPRRHDHSRDCLPIPQGAITPVIPGLKSSLQNVASTSKQITTPVAVKKIHRKAVDLMKTPVSDAVVVEPLPVSLKQRLIARREQGASITHPFFVPEPDKPVSVAVPDLPHVETEQGFAMLGRVEVGWSKNPQTTLFRGKPQHVSYLALARAMEMAHELTFRSTTLNLNLRQNGDLTKDVYSPGKIVLSLRLEPSRQVVARLLAVRKAWHDDKEIDTIAHVLKISATEFLSEIPVLRKDGKRWVPDTLRLCRHPIKGPYFRVDSIEQSHQSN